MPYKWTRSDTATDQLRLWPHRSLDTKGFVTFIGTTALFFLVPLSAVLGTVVLWWILPFMLGTLWLTWELIQKNLRDRELLEILTLEQQSIRLSRENPNSETQTWDANPFWVRVEIDEKGGPVENYITLHGSGREVELGAFLSPAERLVLYKDLTDRLRRLDINAH